MKRIEMFSIEEISKMITKLKKWNYSDEDIYDYFMTSWEETYNG